MNAIPKQLHGAFVGFMDAYNDDDLPDGAWFAVLEGAALRFINDHDLDADENDAVHEYLELKSAEQRRKK